MRARLAEPDHFICPLAPAVAVAVAVLGRPFCVRLQAPANTRNSHWILDAFVCVRGGCVSVCVFVQLELRSFFSVFSLPPPSEELEKWRPHRFECLEATAAASTARKKFPKSGQQDKTKGAPGAKRRRSLALEPVAAQVGRTRPTGEGARRICRPANDCRHLFHFEAIKLLCYARDKRPQPHPLLEGWPGRWPRPPAPAAPPRLASLRRLSPARGRGPSCQERRPRCLSGKFFTF